MSVFLIVGIAIAVCVFLYLAVGCVLDRRANRRMSSKVISNDNTHQSVIVPVGLVYDTAAMLLGRTGGSSGDDVASLNGDEYLYADSEPPTEEELRARNDAMLRIVLEDSLKEKEDLMLVAEMLSSSELMDARAADGKAAGVECAVCIEEIEASEIYRELPCGHQFHRDCIDPWLEQSVTCPMCATSIVETAPPLQVETARASIEKNRRVLAEQARYA